MPASETQGQLRAAFRRWGVPRRVRVDNGSPWGSVGELPTDLALWLIGLGVEVIWNPPRRPQANGVVERSQGTGKRWAEPARCPDPAELQRRLDEQDAIQRERYPSIGGRSRLAPFPALRHSGRRYTTDLEASQWDLRRVLDHLAGYVVVRRLDSSGTVSLYNRSRYVCYLPRGTEVYIRLDPVEVEWVFASREGICYRRQRAEELTAEQIDRLGVSRHRIRAKPKRHNPVPRLPAQPIVG